MLASFPVSMLNQKPSDLGIPNRFKLDPSRSRVSAAKNEAIAVISRSRKHTIVAAAGCESLSLGATGHPIQGSGGSVPAESDIALITGAPLDSGRGFE
jgi:hypothetical protein